MARRITNGIQGRNILGNIVAVNNSLRSVVDNANVILQPNGTGISVSVTDLQVNSANSLRLADNDSSNFIGLRAPATVASNVTLTLPNTAGSSDQFLRTDGSGNLTWVAPFVSVANQLADATTYYPTLTTATSGTVSTVNTSSTKLSYQPSTGRLSSTELRATANTTSSSTSTGALVVTGGLGVQGATFCNTLTATSITETSSIILKENVSPIANALDVILNLEGVNYTRKSNGK
jgi:hypothetical protein